MSVNINISDVNSLSDDKFESIFGNVIELCSAAAVSVKKLRPFAKVSDLQDAFSTYLQDLTYEDKLEILKRHPDLAGRLAEQGRLTKESTNEQQAAGLHELTPEQKDIIDKYNDRYKTKFGFPFIICARENKIQSIMDGLQQRYCNTKEQEVKICLEEVKKICKLRINDIVKDN